MKNVRFTAAACALSLSAVLTAGPVLAADSAAENATSSVESLAEDAMSISESMAEDAMSVAEEIVAERPVYAYADYVTLGQYKGLEITVAPVEVSDEEVEEEIKTRISFSDEGSETFEEGTVEEGDVANIDYEGKKDGVAFDGGTYEGYDLTIGSGTFIPGFEEGLVGAEIGSTIELPLTFPEEYGNEELAGQDVVFTVTINSVTRYKELDDELAAALSDGEAEDAASYRELVKSELFKDASDTRDEDTRQELASMAIANCTFSEFPEDLVAYDVAEMKAYYTSMASMYGMELADFMAGMYGLTEEQFDQIADLSVRQALMQEFALNQIAEEEGLAEEETLKKAYDDLAAQYGFENGDELIATYGESSVRNAAVNDLVLDFLMESAIITESADSGVESIAEDVLSAAESIAEDVLSAAESAAEDAMLSESE